MFLNMLFILVALSLRGESPDVATLSPQKAPPRSSGSRPPIKPGGDDSKVFEPLQGSWGVTKATMNGKASRDASLLEGDWAFAGNQLILQSPQKGRARFSLTMDAKAKAFHLASVEPPNTGAGWILFSREEENLKIAFFWDSEEAPRGEKVS